jgi:hypothetical protein
VGQEVTEERTFSGQEKDIIDYMTEKGSITTLEAFGIGVARLASRVYDLRTKGIPIKREMVDVLNRKGEKCRVARYWLAA